MKGFNSKERQRANRRANRYPNGYLPKIEYWKGKLLEANSVMDFEEVARCADKCSYFAKKHQELIDAGEMVPGQTGTLIDPDLDPAGGYGLASHV